MTRILLSMGFACLFAGAVAAQSFPEDIPAPDSVLGEVAMPQSPFTTQVLFIGGHDLVTVNGTYGNPVGRAIAKEWHDFIGFTADDSQGGLGWVSVNHEMIYRDDYIGDGGGNTMFYVKRDGDSLVVMETTIDASDAYGVASSRTGKFHAVDFVNTVGETGMNCGGITDPYTGRIWTAEEWFRRSNAASSSIFFPSTRDSEGNAAPIRPNGSAAVAQGVRDTTDVEIADFDKNGEWGDILGTEPLKKFQTFNYMVEIDPYSAKAIRKQVNWFRQGWEGGTVAKDGTVYLGPDATPGYWGKFVPADNSNRDSIDYTEGTYYVYKHDKPADSEGGKWVEIAQTRENVLDFGTAAAAAGGTQYNRLEWVAIDTTTGYIYWTETGSTTPFDDLIGTNGGAVHDPYHLIRAQQRGWEHPDSAAYRNHYGAVWLYDPVRDTQYVYIAGGPEFNDISENDALAGSYPDKHLTNPDGLNVIYINDDQGGVQSFLVICEDANGTSFNRAPAEWGSVRLCELFLLDLSLGQQTVLQGDTFDTDHSNLIRISAVPAGAEVTGAQPTSDGATLLVNSQHPSAALGFPWNHSLTYAINGFDNLVVTDLNEEPQFDPQMNEIQIFPNPTTRIVNFSQIVDVAVYNNAGQRIRVHRNVQQIDVTNLSAGIYYLMFQNNEGMQSTKKLIVE